MNAGILINRNTLNLHPSELTCNDMNSYVPYNTIYSYGNNLGYYGGSGNTYWNNQNIAQLAFLSGAHTTRPDLPDIDITGISPTFALSDYQYYTQTLGMNDLTTFLGQPYSLNQDMTVYPGTAGYATASSNSWKGLYLDPWLDLQKTKINPSNTFASYIYHVGINYGQYNKFWEIINEPDFTYDTSDASQWNSNPIYLPSTSWWLSNPWPNQLPNLQCPVFFYIRMLRIAWEVMKVVAPHTYICTGGIGYTSFLNILLTNTDNPGSGDPSGLGSGLPGSVTPAYPLKGGAYFDVISFHTYPFYHISYWNNNIGGFIYNRHSDYCLAVHLQTLFDMQISTQNAGYNGLTYSKKGFICTETDIPRQDLNGGATGGGTWGTQSAQINYIIKMHVMSQANDMYQVYKYAMADGGDASGVFNIMGCYGNITPPGITTSNVYKEPVWYATKTLDNLLYGTTYSQVQTSLLNLNPTLYDTFDLNVFKYATFSGSASPGINGASFEKNGAFTYVLWAQTNIDNSEYASATYTFPFSQYPGTRAEWNYSLTGVTVSCTATVHLSGTPSFFF